MSPAASSSFGGDSSFMAWSIETESGKLYVVETVHYWLK